MNKIFHRDVFFSTLSVFFCIFLFKFLFVNTHFLDPVKNALKDFEVLDLANTRFRHNSEEKQDTNIVIVNIADLDREGIAGLLNTINHFHPKAVGLDVVFKQLKDPAKDSALLVALANTPNLIKACEFEYENEHAEAYSGIKYSHPLFDSCGEDAFVNFIAAENQSTIRYFIPYEIYKNKKVNFFSNALADKFLGEKNSGKEGLKDPGPEMIHYKGNRENYMVFEPAEITDSNQNLRIIQGKIVLLGFMGLNNSIPSFEDIHFTPMNPKYSGRSFPDMYGTMIHANIISMLIDKQNIHEIPKWLTLLLAFIICYIHMYFFIRYYIHRHLWFHLFFKIVQLVTSVLLVGFSLYIFIRYRIMLESSVILTPIVLSVDILYFYDALVKALHKKFGYHTYFMNH